MSRSSKTTLIRHSCSTKPPTAGKRGFPTAFRFPPSVRLPPLNSRRRRRLLVQHQRRLAGGRFVEPALQFHPYHERWPYLDRHGIQQRKQLEPVSAFGVSPTLGYSILLVSSCTSMHVPLAGPTISPSARNTNVPGGSNAMFTASSVWNSANGVPMAAQRHQPAGSNDEFPCPSPMSRAGTWEIMR